MTRLVPFGAFVQVEGGVEGIIPNCGDSAQSGRQAGWRCGAGRTGRGQDHRLAARRAQNDPVAASPAAAGRARGAGPREPREPREPRAPGAAAERRAARREPAAGAAPKRERGRGAKAKSAKTSAPLRVGHARKSRASISSAKRSLRPAAANASAAPPKKRKSSIQQRHAGRRRRGNE